MYYILSKQYYYIKVMTPRHIYLLTLVLDKLVKSTNLCMYNKNALTT